jgi:hypothetical protein
MSSCLRLLIVSWKISSFSDDICLLVIRFATRVLRHKFGAMKVHLASKVILCPKAIHSFRPFDR